MEKFKYLSGNKPDEILLETQGGELPENAVEYMGEIEGSTLLSELYSSSGLRPFSFTIDDKTYFAGFSEPETGHISFEVEGIFSNERFYNGNVDVSASSETTISDFMSSQNAEPYMTEKALALIVPPFDAAKAYSKGDLVMYDNVLKVCKNDISAHAYVSGEWDTATLDSLFKGKADASVIDGKQDKLPNAVNGLYLHANKDTGALEWATANGLAFIGDVSSLSTIGDLYDAVGNSNPFSFVYQSMAFEAKFDHPTANDYSLEAECSGTAGRFVGTWTSKPATTIATFIAFSDLNQYYDPYASKSDLAAKQNSLTTSSVADGTLASNIGFDSNGVLKRQNVDTIEGIPTATVTAILNGTYQSNE